MFGLQIVMMITFAGTRMCTGDSGSICILPEITCCTHSLSVVDSSAVRSVCQIKPSFHHPPVGRAPCMHGMCSRLSPHTTCCARDALYCITGPSLQFLKEWRQYEERKKLLLQEEDEENCESTKTLTRQISVKCLKKNKTKSLKMVRFKDWIEIFFLTRM